MRKFIIRQFSIAVASVMLSSNTSADNDCLNICDGNNISGRYEVYFENQEGEAEVKYRIGSQSMKGTSASSESVVKKIEFYSERESSCNSTLVCSYSCEESLWRHFDNYFDAQCRNKTLLLTVKYPRDLYITAKLMDNDSIIHSDTTHLMRKPGSYYYSGQCLAAYNQCRGPLNGSIVSIEPIEGPGVFKTHRNGVYKLYVNYDETSHETYKYKIALKIKTSKEGVFHGMVLNGRSPCGKYEKLLWVDRNLHWYRYLYSKDVDRYHFAGSIDDGKIIIYNYSNKFINRKLVFHVIRSKARSLRIEVIKDNQTQSCDRFLSGGQRHIPIPDESIGYATDEPIGYVEDGPCITTRAPSMPPSELITTTYLSEAPSSEMVFPTCTRKPNITRFDDIRNQTGNVTQCSDGDKLAPFIFSLLAVATLVGSL